MTTQAFKTIIDLSAIGYTAASWEYLARTKGAYYYYNLKFIWNGQIWNY